ncbi:MAG: exosortase/archaeosortase family protein [Candidatus Lokiarchaeota archaeon]|nr:exosortase/archaeosortase family protein [Candidatus Lokiarchaeota archaeon]
MNGTDPINMGIVMIPLLCFMNYSIVDRLNFYINEIDLIEDNRKKDNEDLKEEIPIVEVDSKKEISYWFLFTINTLSITLFGYLLNTSYFIISFLIISMNLIFVFILTYFFTKSRITKLKYPIYALIGFLSILCIGFISGISIPFFESENLKLIVIIIVPLLCLGHFNILKNLNTHLIKEISKKDEIKLPIIEYENKRYIFSLKSLIILGFGAPFLIALIYYFFAWRWNYWLHEIVVKQTTFFLNLIFDMGVTNTFLSIDENPWVFEIPGQLDIHLETFCTGIQAICIFVGIFILTPHSKDPRTNKDTLWRKIKGIILSSLIFYVVNILRMIIQLYLYYLGYPWNDIHYSISVASSFIAVIIVLLMHKWVPEFILSFIYAYSLTRQNKIKKPKF